MAKSATEKAQMRIAMGRHFARIANAPLKREGTSDAWNERQNRLTASRDAAKLLMSGTRALNRAKKKR